ncbi:unnamed protein product [Microthlaspi erraticum]|uniref:Uncharacterized protein n=1 Tax=Microthlaspi erraticum TaxID=1685480 RepID=A0A6D2JF34_9BRAS|nr:unnamed protein product [Microthlaspi erraticum]
MPYQDFLRDGPLYKSSEHAPPRPRKPHHFEDEEEEKRSHKLDRAKFGGANSSSIELGVKTRKVVFWSILEHMGHEEHGGTWHGRSSTGHAKEEGRSHLEDQLDRLLDQPVEFLNSTGQASTRSSWKSKSNPKNVASPLTFL